MTAKSNEADPVSPAGANWELADVVNALRARREAALAARFRLGKAVKLPSRKALANIVDGLSAALFPNRLGSRQLTTGSVDYFVGRTLDLTLRELVDEIVRELKFSGSQDAPEDQLLANAHHIAREFASRLPELRAMLESDLLAAFEGDPAATSIDEVLVCYPGITATIHYRLAHSLHQLGAPLVARIIGEIAHSITGVDIHPGADIRGSFFIDHGTGVVIGETAVIGERVRLYHGVTLGAKRFAVDDNGALIKGIARHPIVEDDVVIYAGATILGRVTVGRGSIIGGNVWLTHSVPPASQISQAKTRDEQFGGGSGI